MRDPTTFGVREWDQVPARMPDVVHELLTTEAAIEKLGARVIAPTADRTNQRPPACSRL